MVAGQVQGVDAQEAHPVLPLAAPVVGVPPVRAVLAGVVAIQIDPARHGVRVLMLALKRLLGACPSVDVVGCCRTAQEGRAWG